MHRNPFGPQLFRDCPILQAEWVKLLQAPPLATNGCVPSISAPCHVLGERPNSRAPTLDSATECY